MASKENKLKAVGMITIDLSKGLCDLKGKEIEGGNTLGELIANFLVSDSKGPALKFFEWAEKLNDGGIIEVDSSDFDTFKSFVETNERMTILVKGQVLRELRKAQ